MWLLNTARYNSVHKDKWMHFPAGKDIFAKTVGRSPISGGVFDTMEKFTPYALFLISSTPLPHLLSFLNEHKFGAVPLFLFH